jgi:hypothetical protein
VDERRRRLDAIRGWVQAHSLERWLDALLADFDAAAARKRPAASR